MKPCFQHFQSWKGSLSLRFAPYPVNKSHVQQHEKYWWEVHILQFKAKSLLTGGLVLKASDLTGELSSHYWNNFTLLWFCLWDFLFLKLKQCTLIRTIKALKNVHKTYNVWFCFKSTKVFARHPANIYGSTTTCPSLFQLQGILQWTKQTSSLLWRRSGEIGRVGVEWMYEWIKCMIK